MRSTLKVRQACVKQAGYKSFYQPLRVFARKGKSLRFSNARSRLMSMAQLTVYSTLSRAGIPSDNANEVE